MFDYFNTTFDKPKNRSHEYRNFVIMKPFPALKIFSGPYLFHALVWLVYGVYNLMNIQGYVTRKGWFFHCRH